MLSKAFVGFAAGGIPEMVEHPRTGWLSAIADQSALNQNLREALTGGDLAKVGQAAREVVLDRFNADTFGGKHLELYEELIK